MRSSIAVMHVRFLLTVILIGLLVIPAWGQDDPITSDDGPVILDLEIEENLQSIPIDEETGTVNWDEYLSLPAGGGASFGFTTVLYPPDPAALANSPEFLLDTAWFPPIPFALGLEPPESGQVSTRGWLYLEDASGNLARRDMDITMDGDVWFCSTWYLGGSALYHLEEGWTEGYFQEVSYLPDGWTGGGIDYFLRSVWFNGVLGGNRMENLLNVCGANRIGRALIEGGSDRLAIFQILPNEMDRQNGRGSLLVWLTIGHWQLVRTRLHATYATEMIHYYCVSAEVENDPMVFHYENLPDNIYWSIDQYLLTHAAPFWAPVDESAFDLSTHIPEEFPEGSIVVTEPEDDEGSEDEADEEAEGEGDSTEEPAE